MFNELKHVQTIKRNQNQVQPTSIDDLTSCKDKIRPVANHRRQSINKAHSIPYLKSLKKRLGAIQSYLHYIQPSIGVGFKIWQGALYFSHQMVKLRGICCGYNKWRQPGRIQLSLSLKNIRTCISLDIYDISLIIENIFLSRHGSHFI